MNQNVATKENNKNLVTCVGWQNRNQWQNERKQKSNGRMVGKTRLELKTDIFSGPV